MPDKVDALCLAALERNAEDLFLKSYEYPCIRVNGALTALGDDILTQEDVGELWMACGVDPALVQDHDVSWTSGDGHRFRINLFRHMGRLGAALRPIKNSVPVLDALGLPGERMRSWGSRTQGLVLICGGTGAGKSTTIASLLDWINRTQTKHIVTIEDPIEYLIAPQNSVVTQREVGTDTESFLTGLRSALRQSPDVIFIGEIRDRTTARTALRASETGHLVLTTLHSSNVAESFERLASLFPAEDRESALLILAKQLVGILCQRLVPTVNGGLIPLTEHLENAGAVRNWVRDWELERIAEFLDRGLDTQNRRLLDSIREAYQSGQISEDTARSACSNPAQFDQLASGIRGTH